MDLWLVVVVFLCELRVCGIYYPSVVCILVFFCVYFIYFSMQFLVYWLLNFGPNVLPIIFILYVYVVHFFELFLCL
jgi:hypothetical protein